MELVLDIVLDAVKDTAVLVPFLFVTYLVLETLEHTAAERVNALIKKAGPAGPVVGAVLGVVPQCGFSAMGATLYAGRVITLGTLVAVFLSTSDEMLPILIAERPDPAVIAGILVSKAIIGMVAGVLIDVALRVLRSRPRSHAALRRGILGASVPVMETLSGAGADATHIHELCERDHCGCGDEGHGEGDGHGHGSHDHHGRSVARHVLHGAVSHTVQVTAFIFVVTLVLAGVIDTVGEDVLASVLSSNEVPAVFFAALVGLIPNCAASIIITQLYLEGALALGPMMAGTLVAAGAGFLVLFRTNKNVRENVAILAVLYVIAVVCGLVITFAL